MLVTIICIWSVTFGLFLQQLRKLLLEIIHRIPSNEHLKKYVQQILSLMFKLIKVSILILLIFISLNKIHLASLSLTCKQIWPSNGLVLQEKSLNLLIASV